MVVVVSPITDLVGRVRAEYLEMPGLRLTDLQAQRLFGLSATECRDVLDVLQRSGFLSRSPRTGLMVRARA